MLFYKRRGKNFGYTCRMGNFYHEAAEFFEINPKNKRESSNSVVKIPNASKASINLRILFCKMFSFINIEV